MISITYTTSNPEEMKTIAKDILLKCSGPGIFTFSGNLGAGKTTLIREMCHHLGYKGDVKIEVNSEGVRKIDVFKIPETTEIS